MSIWSVLLALSIVGISGLLILKTLKPDFSIRGDEKLLKERLGEIKKTTLLEIKRSGKAAFHKAGFFYGKSLSFLKKNKVSNLVSGKGVLSENESRSDYLKDIKETRDRVRKEFAYDEEKNLDEAAQTEKEE